MNKVLLIGGSPTIGKSYLARSLSSKYNLPWISTDTIRELIRKIGRQDDYPYLAELADDRYSAKEYLNRYSATEMVDRENNESCEVFIGVKALIETDYTWRSYIVEGVAIIPELVAKLEVEGVQIKPVFLVHNDPDQIRKVIFERGLWDDADKYPDDVKELEIKWVLEFNEYLVSECKKFGYSPYPNDWENANQLIEEIGEWINS